MQKDRWFIPSFAVVLVIIWTVSVTEARRYGGGSSRIGSSSGSRSRGQGVSHGSHSISRPAPSYSAPNSRPAPSYGFNVPGSGSSNVGLSNRSPAGIASHGTHTSGTNTAHSATNINTNNNPYKPSAPPAPPYSPPSSATNQHTLNNYQQKPPSYGFNPSGTDMKKNVNPVNSANVGWNLPPKPGAPVGPPSNKYGSSQQSYNPQHSQPFGGGYGHNYAQGNPGKTKIKVVNKNYYNSHPGHYGLPQPHYQYPGYFQTPSFYNYAPSSTGSGVLGFFLGYSLARMTTPTFSHYSFYDGYRPRYDHYEVHHYYHNKDSVPQNTVVQATTIIGCVGDSSSICPVNTVSLCTSNGAIMCVASALSTVPCTDNRQLNCVKTVIPCVPNSNNTTIECNNQTTSVSIPCVSTAKIEGKVETINNTIISKENVTLMTNSTQLAAPANSTESPPPSTAATIETTTSTDPSRSKRDTSTNDSNQYCVTIVALPAKKATTDGEKVYDTAKSIVGKFFERAWGI